MKKTIDVARAWRDEDYYLSFTEEERASLGNHPAGPVAMSDEVLASANVAGAKTPSTACYNPTTGEWYYCN